ncbi:hypothetical protein CG008_02595 [Mesoplasma florum]|nr:hypothetical protein CG008_02595 [Mesoplasma florum]
MLVSVIISSIISIVLFALAIGSYIFHKKKYSKNFHTSKNFKAYFSSMLCIIFFTAGIMVLLFGVISPIM